MDIQSQEVNPYLVDDEEDRTDRQLVERAKAGDSGALESLVHRHQAFLHNLAIRMLYHPQDAEDATQEILIKVVTNLLAFEGRSRFRTWLYRVATNHLLNMKRGHMEPISLSFTDYGRNLDETPDLDLPDPNQVPVDVRLLVDEARIGCTSAMLLCLDREQRLVYVMGEILGATDVVAAEMLGLTRDAFRQKLSRARRDLYSFMHEKCGLVNKANACRCEKKTRGFMRAGYVDPENLLFARERIRQVREVAEQCCQEIDRHQGLCSEVFRDHPFYAPADLVTRIRQVVENPGFRANFEL
jgi:RNA polymerase sigma factor (sigma-70 family)